MTRRRLNRTLRRVYILLGLVLALSLTAKFADHLGLPRGGLAENFLKDIYEFLRDMSLLIATGGVAYITNLFQKRSSFVDSLKEEWRDIIEAKSALITYTSLEAPTPEQYLEAFARLSATIDNMRIVYRNVGETDDLVGLYPYAPLHDMRRALQTIDPRKAGIVGAPERKLVRDAILQSFYALRESFLEELDLEEPTRPLLIFAARRQKQPGSTGRARSAQGAQRRRQERTPAPDAEVETLLVKAYEREQDTPKAWRPVDAARASNGGAPAPGPTGSG